MVKIVSISDFHGDLSGIDVPECDILLIAGDILPSTASPGNHKVREHSQWLSDVFAPWLDTVDARHIVGVAGNHDFIFQVHKDMVPKLNWHYLENSSVEIDGIKIWGSPWTKHFHNWAFNSPMNIEDSNAFLNKLWGSIPLDTDVVLTHGPSHGVVDRVTQRFKQRNSLGDEELFNRIKVVQPILHVCGHIHSAHGIEVKRWGDRSTIFINASIVDEYYDSVYKPIIVSIKKHI